MKSKFFRFSFGLFIIAGFFASCSNGVEPDTYGNIKKKAIDIYQFYSPKDSTETVFWDDFEGPELTSKNQWSSTNASLTTLSDVRNDLVSQNSSYEGYYNSLFGGAESTIAKLDAKYYTTSNLTYSNLNLSEDCYLTFRYFFVGVDGSTFKIILDNKNGENGFTLYENSLQENYISIPIKEDFNIDVYVIGSKDGKFSKQSNIINVKI